MSNNEFLSRFVYVSLSIVGEETLEFFGKLDSIPGDRLEEMSDRYYDWSSETPECVKERLDREGLFNALSFDDYMDYQDQYKFEHQLSIIKSLEDSAKDITDIIPKWEHISLILQETLPDSWLYYALIEYWILKDKDDDNFRPVFLKFLGDDFMK
jgi:hypothetical protein